MIQVIESMRKTMPSYPQNGKKILRWQKSKEKKNRKIRRVTTGWNEKKSTLQGNCKSVTKIWYCNETGVGHALPMNLLLERFIGVSENEYLITVNKQREPTAWADASDAAGIELDRPESRQIANSRATGVVRTPPRPATRTLGKERENHGRWKAHKMKADIDDSPCN